MVFRLRRLRHIKRFRQIAGVLVRHGFGQLLEEAGLAGFVARILQRERPLTGEGRPRARHLRAALEQLGPTFIKTGQLLSTRPDLLPAEYIAELAKLQDRVPPFSFPEVEKIIARELGGSWQEYFTFIEPEPVAAASIGQVHRAVLPDGRQVAIKVRRPGVERVVQTDLEILYEIAHFLDRFSPWARVYDFRGIVQELEDALRAELDYVMEGRNAETLRQNFAQGQEVTFPAVVWPLTTRRLLTMEYLEGIKLTDVEAVTAAGQDRRRLALTLARAVFKMILEDGFFHADPHPGNLLVLSDGRIGFLDCGIVGVIGSELRQLALELLLGFVNKDLDLVVNAVLGLARQGGSSEVDAAALRRELALLHRKYYDLPLDRLRLQETIPELLAVAYRHRLRLPREAVLVAKTLITLEGVAHQLDPSLNVVQLAQSYSRKMWRRFLSVNPSRWPQQVLRWWLLYSRFWQQLPRQLGRVAEVAARGELRCQVRWDMEAEYLRTLERGSRRLAGSWALAALLIGSSLLLGNGNLPPLLRLIASGIWLAGAVLAFWMVLRGLR